MNNQAHEAAASSVMEAVLDVFRTIRLNMVAALADEPPGLVPLHMLLLDLLFRADDVNTGVPQRDLVTASGRDKGQVARLLSELEARGLALRSEDPANRRSRLVTLSAEGRALCERFAAHKQRVASVMFAGQSSDELQLIAQRLHEAQTRLCAAEEGPPVKSDP